MPWGATGILFRNGTRCCAPGTAAETIATSKTQASEITGRWIFTVPELLTAIQYRPIRGGATSWTPQIVAAVACNRVHEFMSHRGFQAAPSTPTVAGKTFVRAVDSNQERR